MEGNTIMFALVINADGTVRDEALPEGIPNQGAFLAYVRDYVLDGTAPDDSDVPEELREIFAALGLLDDGAGIGLLADGVGVVWLSGHNVVGYESNPTATRIVYRDALEQSGIDEDPTVLGPVLIFGVDPVDGHPVSLADEWAARIRRTAEEEVTRVSLVKAYR